jgi:hypothetical protein
MVWWGFFLVYECSKGAVLEFTSERIVRQLLVVSFFFFFQYQDWIGVQCTLLVQDKKECSAFLDFTFKKKRC